MCSTEKLTSELQSRETKCMKLYQRLQRWPECNALAHKLLLKKSVQLPFTPHTHTSHTHMCRETGRLHACVYHSSPDDWQFYPSYFDSLFHLMDQSWAPPAEGDQ